MVVEENGKLYNIDEKTGLVTEASIINEDTEALVGEYRIGDRVEVVGSAGEIVSMVPSYYGVAFGIRFDDGEFDEFVEGQLKRSKAEKKSYDSPILEVYDRYASYAEMPTYTDEEVDRKEEEARWLNLNASTLRTHASQGGILDPKLDEIILTTSSDLKDLKEIKENANTEANKAYLSSFNQYKLSDEIGGYAGSMGGKDDASWLDLAAEGMVVVETTDADLATRAVEVVASLTRDQLSDEEFMRVAGSYQHDYLQMTPEQIKAFDSYINSARAERLKELPETKTASTDNFSLDDATDIYL